MAAPNGPNQLARRVIDDLMDFSGETSADGYMVFFKQHQISNLRSFINRMHEEAATARNEIAQLNALIAEFEALGDQQHVVDKFMDAVKVTPDMLLVTVNELKRRGIDYIIAPHEADAQFAFLSKQGKFDVVIADDAEMVPYGCKRVKFLNVYGFLLIFYRVNCKNHTN